MALNNNRHPRPTSEQIAAAKLRLGVGHHEHDDCVLIAFEWLDAQSYTVRIGKHLVSYKHLIEDWGGRYVSSDDVAVAADLHPSIKGSHPHYNISKRLIWPARERLSGIEQAGAHGFETSMADVRVSKVEYFL